MTSPPFSLLALIHIGIADKRMVFGSDKSCEGVATSLRFSSKPGSFSPGTYGSEAGPPDGPPDSPIKTSPVSERIKALEALAAKKTQSDFRSDGGFSHFRDRHHEKPPTESSKSPVENQKSPVENQKSPNEKATPAVQKMGGSAEQESPESPFEVLGDLRQVNEFEETEEWMKAHLPPVPDFSSVDLTEATKHVASKDKDMVSLCGVPDAFVDSPVEAPSMKDEFGDAKKQAPVEEEFDLNFLPTAYMWDQQEKSGDQPPSNLDSVIASPPAGFGTPSPPLSPSAGAQAQQNSSDEEKAFLTGDRELPEASEPDSSGESDDTVIEDDVGAPTSATSASAAPDVPTVETETPPPKSERKLMQVPTINVIETDEPNYSEEEMEMEPEEEDEDYEVEKQSSSEAPETSQPELEDRQTELPKTRPLETEFMEGYSPPSSPVDSDAEYSPKHKILKSVPEMANQESAAAPETPAKDSAPGISQAPPEKSQTTSNKVNEELSKFTLTNEEVDFPDNDDEWSDEAQEILVKDYNTNLVSKQAAAYSQPKLLEKGNAPAKEETVPLSKTTFMHDEIYDRQSFDYEYDASFPLDDIDHKTLSNAKERFLSDPLQSDTEMLNACTAHTDIPEGRQSLDGITSLTDGASPEHSGQPSLREYPPNPYSFPIEAQSSFSEADLNKKMSRDIVADGATNESSEPADSFVEFMRECLKSRQDEEPDNMHQGGHVKSELGKTSLAPLQSSPITVMDLEQEELTISALKELCSSQEDEEEDLQVQSKASDPDQTDLNSASTQQSSLTSATNPPCFRHSRASDSTYSKEVEAIDEWVAEAYHLAEHVLTAILTHLSGNTSFFWAASLLTC